MFRVQFTRLSLRRSCTLGTSIAMAFDSEWLSSFPSPRTPTWIFSPNDRKHVSALKVPPGKKKRKVVCKYSIPLYCSWRLHCGALLLWRVMNLCTKVVYSRLATMVNIQNGVKSPSLVTPTVYYFYCTAKKNEECTANFN